MGGVTINRINVICNHTSQRANVSISFVAVKTASTIFTDIFIMNNVAMMQKLKQCQKSHLNLQKGMLVLASWEE
jgi:hypothetical protein